MPDSIGSTSFPCRALLAQQEKSRFLRLLYQAAEQRQLSKAQKLAPALESLRLQQQEELLFAQIFRSLGYSLYAEAFESLAEAWPYARICEQMTSGKGKPVVLGNWAIALNLLERAEPVHPSLREEWKTWQGVEPLFTWSGGSLKGGGRPQNHPWRRLTGLYHHLANTLEQGLLKSWLKALWEVEEKLDRQDKPQGILDFLSQLFEPQEFEPLSHLLLPQSKVLSQRILRLVGEARLNVVLANAVIPFFLSWARAQKDKGLEKTLFALFMLLPGEGGNHKTEALQTRFWGDAPRGIKKNLAYYQGMLQFYEDWCGGEPVCEGCGLFKLLGG